MKNKYQIFVFSLLVMVGGLAFATNAYYQTPIKHKTSKLFASKQQGTCLFTNPVADLPWLSAIFANIDICGCSYPNGVSQYTIDGQPAFILQQYYTCEVPPPSIQNVYNCDGSVICQLDVSPTADPNAQPCILGELVNTWQINPDPLNALPWLANIANNANGCGVAQIVDLGVYYGNVTSYWGQHLFATAPGMGLLCPTDLPLVVYNCSGQQVCFNGFMPANAPELCANVLPDLDLSSGTLIWEYQASNTNLCDLVDLIPPADSVVQNIIAEYPCDVCGWQLDWYCNNGQTLLQVSSVPYTLPDGTMIVCSDIPTYYYDATGNQICYAGGLIGGTCTDTSGIDFENLVFQETLWSCNDNTPTCTPNTYGTIVERCGQLAIQLTEDTSTYYFPETITLDTTQIGQTIYFAGTPSDMVDICGGGTLYYIINCYEIIDQGCFCPEYYQPVCGSDGITYPNACFANCAGVSFTEGECGSTTICQMPADSVIANIVAQIDCSICTQNLDLYCDGLNSIIVFTSTGICADFPVYYYDLNGNQICTESGYPPPGYVSPCDGLVNFGNLNFAQNLWSCNDGGCICPEIYAPVCGPDGQVYSNSCFAECEGVYDWTNCNTSQPDTITWGITVCNNYAYTQNLGSFGDEEGATVTTQPTNGIATINFDAQFSQVLTYTPNAGFIGNDTFVVTASGFDVSTGQSYTISITQYIVLVNDCGACAVPADSIVQNLAAQISCDCSHSIDLYCDGNNAVMVVSGGFPCLDYPTRYYDAMGNYLCQSGGLMLPTCDTLVNLNNLVFVQNLSTCAAPCLCPEYYQPVCGSDGITYDNSCFAECAGVSWTDGVCNPTPTDTIYQATYNYTLCPGDSIAIGFTDNFMIGNTLYNWSPDAGQLSCYNPQCRAIWVAPTQNTTYVLDVFTTIGMTHEYYQYNISIDANCDTTTLPCGVALSSLEWLNNLIAQGNAQDPNNCSALLGIYTGTFNGQTVIYAQYNNSCDAPSFIYSCDGTIICSFGGLMPVEDCDTPSNLSPIWTQSVNCNCPDIYAPVCGADGITYGNSCEADCVGVAWTEGACGETPPLCDHPDTMYVCTPPITTINLCPEFCFDGDYTITATPQYFSCSINIEDNCVEYTPVPLFYGNEIVTIIGCQGSLCDTIYYNIFTGICNQPPVALNDTVWIEGATATPIYVLNNDFDAEGNTFSISTHTQPQNGTLTLNGNSFVYTPNAGFEGTDTFEYQICDEDGLCDAATVTIYVSNNVVQTCENEAIHICTQPIMPEWICPEFCNLAGTDVAITNVISQFSCSVYLPANSACVRYTALPLFSGTDTLQIIGCNALGACDTVMALMHVGECPDGEGGKYTNNGIEQSLELHSLSPVPASSDLFVRFTTQQTQAQISITDLNGRTIEQLQLSTISGSPQVQRIEVGYYPAGMYMLSIQTTEGRITQPWIKQ